MSRSRIASYRKSARKKVDNRLLSDFLKQIVEEDDYYEQCKRKALNKLKKGYHLGGNITHTREELHER